VIHPLVRARENAFLARARAEQRPLAVLDVPLLFETGGAARCDGVLVVSAPPDVQRSRVLSRPGMTEQRFGDILARQMPDADKRARATFVVDTAQDMDIARKQVEAIVRQLSGGAKPLSPEDKP
jgi:dephospho-CoA kinase